MMINFVIYIYYFLRQIIDNYINWRQSFHGNEQERTFNDPEDSMILFDVDSNVAEMIEEECNYFDLFAELRSYSHGIDDDNESLDDEMDFESESTVNPPQHSLIVQEILRHHFLTVFNEEEEGDIEMNGEIDVNWKQ